jgi:hypothetical protein
MQEPGPATVPGHRRLDLAGDAVRPKRAEKYVVL